MWLQIDIVAENLGTLGHVHLLGWAQVNRPNCPPPFSEAKESKGSRRNCQISGMAAFIIIQWSRLAPLPGGQCASRGWEGRFYFPSLLQLNSCQCMNHNFCVARCKHEPWLISCPRNKVWWGEKWQRFKKAGPSPAEASEKLHDFQDVDPPPHGQASVKSCKNLGSCLISPLKRKRHGFLIFCCFSFCLR